jgi:hypothetical protein
MNEIHFYSWSHGIASSDPRCQPLESGPNAPRIYLDGKCINGYLIWVISGEQGAACMYQRENGNYVIDESTGRAKRFVVTGNITVEPREMKL